jgi:hypothetical protein
MPDEPQPDQPEIVYSTSDPIKITVVSDYL